MDGERNSDRRNCRKTKISPSSFLSSRYSLRSRRKKMDDNVKRVCEVDMLRKLPESLLFEVLLKLPTKDVVRTSVLSSKWRNLWKCVPGLELDRSDFIDHEAFASFVDRFLSFNSDLPLQKFKLEQSGDKQDADLGPNKRWINTVVGTRKLQHLHLLDCWFTNVIKMPRTIYTCESLVSLMLCEVVLPSPKFVTLPALKIMDLFDVRVTNKLAFEKLISGCQVLESLVIRSCFTDEKEVFRVHSLSLLSFTYDDSSAGAAVNAPRLEYLKFKDYGGISLLSNPGSLVKADIQTVFSLGVGKTFDPSNVPKRNMIRNFLLGISSVKHMVFFSITLEVLYDYSRCEPLPLFCNLLFLRVQFYGKSYELLPFFLESCPNLKSLVLEFVRKLGDERIDILPGPQRLLASLEYVEIEWPLKGEEMEMKLVGYILEKSTILKKLSLSLGDSKEKEESVILRELNAMPRLSSMCQVVVR